MENKRIRILLIEDDLDHSQIIQVMLSKEMGEMFELEYADLLQDGLSRLAEGGIDIVLLDLSLPDSWGFDTFAEVYAQSPDVPIIVLSCLDDERLAVAAVHEGAQDYLFKDRADSDLLVRSIRYAVERHQMLERLKQKTQELEAVEARDRAILDAIPDSIFRVSKAGIILDYRPAKGDNTLEPSEEFSSREVLGILPLGIGQQVMRCVERALRTNEMQSIEYQLECQGNICYYEARVIASGGDEALIIVRDITDLRDRKTTGTCGLPF